MGEKSRVASEGRWPSLPYEAWVATADTLHMWTQIIGKIRLALSPKVNHWWHVPLLVSTRGLTTSPMPLGDGLSLEIEFDFVDHNLMLQTSDGRRKMLALYPRSVAAFHREVFAALKALEIEVSIWNMPVEIPAPIPFDQDHQHDSYDPEYANRFWRALLQIDDVFKEFRGRFVGKSSPVQFFWGSFDLSVSRYSGRLAPERPGADSITREAYSHEVSSCGFWPGNSAFPRAAFFAYAAPAPPGFAEARVRPAQAWYEPSLSEFLLAYEDVRSSSSPRQTLLEFCQSVYAAQATLAGWNRDELETASGAAEVVRGVRRPAPTATFDAEESPPSPS